MIVDAHWYVPNTLSDGIYKYWQLKKKSTDTVHSTMLTSEHTQIT
jgi:hypothetical protein